MCDCQQTNASICTVGLFLTLDQGVEELGMLGGEQQALVPRQDDLIVGAGQGLALDLLQQAGPEDLGDVQQGGLGGYQVADRVRWVRLYLGHQVADDVVRARLDALRLRWVCVRQ